MDTVNINSQLNANIARANISSNIHSKGTAAVKTAETVELSALTDRFEHSGESPVGYEKFAMYRKVSSQLEKLRTMDLPSTGVPNALLIKSTLESLQNEIQAGSDSLSADPYILINLLNNILDKTG